MAGAKECLCFVSLHTLYHHCNAQPLHAIYFHLADKLLETTKMSLQPSSPRLPSPPPPTEIQIGPKSPSLGSSASQEPSIEQSVIEANASRRIHPGTKSVDMAAGPPLVPLSEVSYLPTAQPPWRRLTPPSSIPPSNYKNTSKPFTTTTRNPLIAITLSLSTAKALS